ncbi:hypothetical protein ACROYT_G019511 [Oculina patagonica]
MNLQLARRSEINKMNFPYTMYTEELPRPSSFKICKWTFQETEVHFNQFKRSGKEIAENKGTEIKRADECTYCGQLCWKSS